jgi:uroporphyrinogen decarboxylase
MTARFLRALRRETVDCTPVWLMRQAGRYLPEYRALRAKAGDFLTLCKTPELACEITLQPLARFPLDAAILFSDILTIPDAMGLGLSIDEGIGPRFKSPLTAPADLKRIGVIDPTQSLRYVTDAVCLIKRALGERVPLIGFAGSPWTLATYMIDGSGVHEFKQTKSWLYGAPDALHALLRILAESVTAYLNAQIAAGVDAVMIFDTWGGALSTAAYEEFSLKYMQQIVHGLTPGTPRILFTKGGGLWLERMAATGVEALGVDWSVDIGDARQRVGHKVALQGNLDPAILRAPLATIEHEVDRVLEAYGAGPGHIFNLVHGITPDINPDHVAAMIERVHSTTRPQ